MMQGILRPNARVFIWFGHFYRVGHVSMQIGCTNEYTNYVSWFPMKGKSQSNYAQKWRNYAMDTHDEGSEANREFWLINLNEQKMRNEWAKLNSDQKVSYNQFQRPQYHLLNENCSTIVMEVLLAGGIDASVSAHLAVKSVRSAGRLWTPKRVYEICRALEKKSLAVELEISHKHRPMAWLPVIG